MLSFLMKVSKDPPAPEKNGVISERSKNSAIKRFSKDFWSFRMSQ